MISTDKAVNPANIMGATKRIAERLVQFRNSVSQTQFVTVRFGNVLGSNGSVVPLFEKQIQSGGPVTVTHPDMRRYFMLIPEAVQLVLQAAELGAGGEIFVLDMGEQVKIVDLARKMIQLSGYQNHEIEIVYTGLRPGEKLYEELFDSSEKTLHSSHKKIRMALPEDGLTEARVEELVEDVKKILSEGQYSDILRFVRTYVPTFSGDVWVGTG
jgi:FlaA1/EpsC-like NDP-sugar epimerase